MPFNCETLYDNEAGKSHTDQYLNNSFLRLKSKQFIFLEETKIFMVSKYEK